MKEKVVVGRFHVIRFVERLISATLGGILGGLIVHLLK